MRSEVEECECSGSRPSAVSQRFLLICIALVVAISAVYFQVLQHPFMNIDDKSYVTNNPYVSNGINLRSVVWAFASSHSGNWHPVTWLSHMLDVQLFGLNPHGHHFTNLFLHSIATLLVLFLFSKFTGLLWRSAFVAAMFALHPLHVESVAWIAERKDVLSAACFGSTLLFYFKYAKSGSSPAYWLAGLSFVIGLMSKPMLVTVPVVMLLLDYWPLDRYRLHHGRDVDAPAATFVALLKEKIPFFLASLASSAVTVYAQQKAGAVTAVKAVSVCHRIENALLAYVAYLWKTIWPLHLAVYYPLKSSFPLWQVAASLALLIAVSVAVFKSRRTHPYLVVGWGWFLIMLVPVIGIVQVGDQAMADRYSYLPSIGLFIMAAWGVPDLLRARPQRRLIAPALAGFVIAAMSVLSWQQVGFWRDDITLFRHALAETSDNYFVHNVLGLALADAKQKDEAIVELKESLRIYSNYAEAHINLGMLLAQKGDLAAATSEFRTATALDPNDPDGHKYLGTALLAQGDRSGAVREYQRASQLEPNSADCHFRLGQALAQTGDSGAAVREFRAALQINPQNVTFHNHLGLTLASRGDLTAAIQEFRASVAIDPTSPGTHNNLGYALASIGDLDGAIQEYRAALSIDPAAVQTRNNLEALLAKRKKM
jgi:protein O-mannosyl-transferase